MLSRLAERVVTGPLAFLLAGAVDVALAWGRWGLYRVRMRRRRPAR
ncbi:MAG: hypothetical protein WBC33_05705 [Conexibacter sp.]